MFELDMCSIGILMFDDRCIIIPLTQYWIFFVVQAQNIALYLSVLPERTHEKKVSQGWQMLFFLFSDYANNGNSPE